MCSFKSYLHTEDDSEALQTEDQIVDELEDFKWIVRSCEEKNMKNFTLDVPTLVKAIKIFESECFGYECKENSHCHIQR